MCLFLESFYSPLLFTHEKLYMHIQTTVPKVLPWLGKFCVKTLYFCFFQLLSTEKGHIAVASGSICHITEDCVSVLLSRQLYYFWHILTVFGMVNFCYCLFACCIFSEVVFMKLAR